MITWKRGAWLAALLLLAGLLAGPAAAQRRRPAQKKPRPTATKTTRKQRPVARATQRRRRRPAREPDAAPAGPSKAQLERERQANLTRIAEAGQVLSRTTQRKQATLGQLNVIKEKLNQKQTQIAGISTQLTGLERDVSHTSRQVVGTVEQLTRLKAEYGRLMYTASKTSQGFNQLMFLFAAESFNEFVRRLRYVRQYGEERQRQALRILGTQQQLGRQLDGLTRQRQRQQRLLRTQLQENQNLLGLKSEQDEVVQQLSQQESGLRQELRERQRAVARLDELIAQRVRAEIARAARAARLAAAAAARTRRAAEARSTAARVRRPGRPGREEAAPADDEPATSGEATAAADNPTAAPESDAPEETTSADRRARRVALTPETKLVSDAFADNRGRLPWPVARGFVSQHFGRHPHPVLRHVQVDNRGVDIQTAPGEPVRAVFGGRVLTVAQVPGMGTIVMVQHGEYFTVYAKLASVSVSEGQQLAARQPLGTAAADADGTAQVQFQVWRNSANLNPEGWLGRK